MKPWRDLSPRERDALVAERVMGGENAHPDWYWFRNIVVHGLPDLPKVEGQEPLFTGPHFTTDIAAAWKVVEKLDGAGRFGTYNWCIDEMRDGWKVKVREGMGTIGEALAYTVQESICLAALMVCGYDPEKGE